MRDLDKSCYGEGRERGDHAFMPIVSRLGSGKSWFLNLYMSLPVGACVSPNHPPSSPVSPPRGRTGETLESPPPLAPPLLSPSAAVGAARRALPVRCRCRRRRSAPTRAQARRHGALRPAAVLLRPAVGPAGFGCSSMRWSSSLVAGGRGSPRRPAGSRSAAGGALPAQIWALWAPSGLGRAVSDAAAALLVDRGEGARAGVLETVACLLQCGGRDFTGPFRARPGQ